MYIYIFVCVVLELFYDKWIGNFNLILIKTAYLIFIEPKYHTLKTW